MTAILYPHWSEVKDWRWVYFSPKELACHGDGSLLVVPEAIDMLEGLRRTVGAPLVITSAYRSPLHNARVGGAALSKHKYGVAFDISLAGHDRFKLKDSAMQCGFRGFGCAKTFLHIDVRPRMATWFYGNSKDFWKEEGI